MYMSCREYFVSFPRLKPAPAALCINFVVWSHGLHLLSEDETREGQRVLGGREEEGAGVFFFFVFVFLNSVFTQGYGRLGVPGPTQNGAKLPPRLRWRLLRLSAQGLKRNWATQQRLIS